MRAILDRCDSPGRREVEASELSILAEVFRGFDDHVTAVDLTILRDQVRSSGKDLEEARQEREELQATGERLLEARFPAPDDDTRLRARLDGRAMADPGTQVRRAFDAFERDLADAIRRAIPEPPSLRELAASWLR
jgi:hypothetical protein